MNKRTFFTLFICYCLLIVGSYFTKTPTQDITVSKLPSQPSNNLFKGNFESNNFSGWVLEASRKDSIKIIKSPVRKGKYAVKFTLYPDDQIFGGHRSELACYNKYPLGSEVYYKFSLMVPNDYAENDMWQIFSQFHDLPDYQNGETRDVYNSHRKLPPPVSLSYSKGEIITQRYDVRDGYHIVASTKIKKGKWVDLVYHIKWSLGEDGFIEVFVNGKNASNGKTFGPNVYNTSGNYLKIGFYTDKRIPTTNTLFFDEVYISQSKKDIMN